MDHLSQLYTDINRWFLADEPAAVAAALAALGDYDSDAVSAQAESLIAAVRAGQAGQAPDQAFLHEYGLSSEEGIVLMRIAEALLRIPDDRSRQLFLREKLAAGDWSSHRQHSESWLVNLATSILTLGGKMESRLQQAAQPLWDRLLARLGEPLLAAAVAAAVRQLAGRFVFAETIAAAQTRAARQPASRHAFDMLGEAALTEADAERYHRAYLAAIAALADTADRADLFANANVSIKLSALCPRFEAMRHRLAVAELTGRLRQLAVSARAADISVTVDAEEAERLQLTLDVFAAVHADPALRGWGGLGLAVQAYQKRALPVLHWLAGLAATSQCAIPVRLVKGAYWDGEIKRAQENGWPHYPVYTDKAATDVGYLACARFMLDQPQTIYPQFATHNAHTVAAILHFGRGKTYEFQRLHGMGSALYAALHANQPSPPCRIYAPVGHYRELLPYLVRRLLENGANTSFVNQVEDPHVSIAELSADPVRKLRRAATPALPLPTALFADRRNAGGPNLADLAYLQQTQRALQQLAGQLWQAAPLIAGDPVQGRSRPVYSPHDRSQLVGNVVDARPEHAVAAMTAAARAFADWRQTPVAKRAECLQTAADLLESRHLPLLSLCMREGGRTLRDAVAEIREAVDYCRYYAACALQQFAEPAQLPGPTGERNQLFLGGRGVFLCISPWNFPIAICIGQISAALVSGNTVIAKPAPQTSLTAAYCVELLHQAGIPPAALQLLPGDGSLLAAQLLPDPRLAGVAFTGSTATAAAINRQLAARQAAIVPFIAETGGQNALIADVSAHEEQLVSDALHSAFNSAGQRCSALRVLFLPAATADRIIARLIGAMRLLQVGPPTDFATDVGPIIDQTAAEKLRAHYLQLQTGGKLLYQTPLPAALHVGCFFAPTLAEIPDMAFLQCEVFGPFLHVVRYRPDQLPKVIEQINAAGYGLTLGIHSRIDANIQRICAQARVGNIYVNRNLIGAVVGVQPFGGMGLSGTGPKAGGPHYLQRFCCEQTVTANLTAIGGNPWLLNPG